MGGGNACKSKNAQSRNSDAKEKVGGGGKDGIAKRTGDTSSKIADATAEREKVKAEKAAREEAKRAKAEKEAKRLAKLNA